MSNMGVRDPEGQAESVSCASTVLTNVGDV